MTTKLELGRATLGVVGGGQLGRMMSWPCHRMGKLRSPFQGPAMRKASLRLSAPRPRVCPRLRFALATLCAVRTAGETCPCSGRQEEGCFLLINQCGPAPLLLRASSTGNGRTFSAEMGSTAAESVFCAAGIKLVCLDAAGKDAPCAQVRESISAFALCLAFSSKSIRQ